MKKREIIITILIMGSILSLTIFLCSKHRVKNIFDEIMLTGDSYLSEPYTKTTYRGIDAIFTDRDLLRSMDAKASFYMENEKEGIITECTIWKDRMDIESFGLEIVLFSTLDDAFLFRLNDGIPTGCCSFNAD